MFWLKLSLSIIIFAAIVMLGFPVIGRWFFKRFDDNVSQYIFVLAMVFFGAVLSEMAGITAIIGAFLTGLVLNRLIPRTSPLMNRINFVGNAIFIPFFLIGVGMLIDYRVFFTDLETIKVSLTMVVIATLGKFITAWLFQKNFRFTPDERRVIFGLSNAQAAATLAAVLIGYNIILGQTEDGQPIRLLSESILNGTIVMILVTCTIASFITQKGARNIALAESSDIGSDEAEIEERILIPISNPETVDELINLSVMIKAHRNKEGLFALNIIDYTKTVADAGRKAKKMLESAEITASATDNNLQTLLRYDYSIVNGISSVVKEHRITHLVLGLHEEAGIPESFLGELTEGILSRCNTTTLLYKHSQPLSTIKRHLIIIPEHAEREIGFPFWLVKVWNIARNTGSRLVFYSPEKVMGYIREIHSKHPVEAEFIHYNAWNNFLLLLRDVKKNDNLFIVLSRKYRPSFHYNMINIPAYLNGHFKTNSVILVYPMQEGVTDHERIDLNNPSLLESIEKLDEIGKTIAGLFRKK